MLKIKLTPVGKKNDRHYRIVVMEGKSKLTGNVIDTLGHYHPLLTTGRLTIDKDRVKAWTAKGAVLTATVRTLLKR